MRRAADERAHLIVSCAPLLARGRQAAFHDRSGKSSKPRSATACLTQVTAADDYLKGRAGRHAPGPRRSDGSTGDAEPGRHGPQLDARRTDKARASYEQYLQDAWKGKVS